MTPSIQIGTVTQGTSFNVTRTGTNENPVLNFTLVKGDKGDRGIQGIQGLTGNGISSIRKTGTDGLVDTYTITYTNGNTTTFTITNGEDGEVTETELDVLRQKIADQQKVISQLPQVTGQGTEVTLENTIEAQFTKFDEEGNSEQESTKGYQLFDIGKSASDYSSNVGNSLVINEKSIQMKVLPSGQTITYRTQNLIGNKKYTINGNASLVYSRLYVRMRKNDDSGWLTNSDASIEGWSYNSYYQGWYKENEPKAINQIVTIPECKYWQIGFGFNSLEAAVNTTQTISDIMLNEGTSAHEWEKYTGGIASPNPNYEQPIKSAGDNGTINEKIQTRNMLNIADGTYTPAGSTYGASITFKDGVGKINIGQQAGSFGIKIPLITPVKLKANQSYTRANNSGKVYPYVALYDSEGKTMDSMTASDNGIKVYTPTENKEVFYIYLWFSIQSYGDIKPMMTKGSYTLSTMPDFVVGKGQTYTIPTQQPMRSIGDVRDCFVKVNGNWYERHYIGRYRLLGSKVTDFNTTYNRFTLLETGINTLEYTSKGMSNVATVITNGSVNASYTNSMIIRQRPNGGFYIYGWLDGVTSIEEAKNYLDNNEVYVEFPLAEPLDLPCTEEQIVQLENLPSTYKDFTIIQSEDETPAYLEVSGVYDLNNLINN